MQSVADLVNEPPEFLPVDAPNAIGVAITFTAQLSDTLEDLAHPRRPLGPWEPKSSGGPADRRVVYEPVDGQLHLSER
jgi:hypothetical protein